MQIIIKEIGWRVGDVTIPPPKPVVLIGFCKRQRVLGRFYITPQLLKAKFYRFFFLAFLKCAQSLSHVIAFLTLFNVIT